MVDRRRNFDAGLPGWLANLMNAGRELASIVEDDIQACGNSPPHDREHCPDCEPQRLALRRWVSAVVTARKANGQ